MTMIMVFDDDDDDDDDDAHDGNVCTKCFLPPLFNFCFHELRIIETATFFDKVKQLGLLESIKMEKKVCWGGSC